MPVIYGEGKANTIRRLRKEIAEVKDRDYALNYQLSDEEKKCRQLFRLTLDDKDGTYEWFKDGVKDRVESTCEWFLIHETDRARRKPGKLLVSADPGCR
jgi:hypothetical protein